MGAIISTTRNPGDDHTKTLIPISPPIDQSYIHISKKPKLSVINRNENSPHYSSSSYSVLRCVTSYPDLKSRVLREVHAPIRRSRFGSFWNLRTVVGKMGNCLGIGKVNYGAIKCLGFGWKDKEKLVIEIDDDDKENLGDLSDDSSVEEVEIIDVSRSNGYRDVSLQGFKDITNVNGFEVPVHKKKYELAKTRDEKLSSLDLEMRLQRLELVRPRKKEEQVKKDEVDECFVPLTEEEEVLVAHALSNSNRRKVLASHENSNVDITEEVLQCLRPGAWLNDEVINLYLELLKEREGREPQKFLKCHFFNTFFYKKLISARDGYNFQAVRRWTSERMLGYNLLDCEKIFVPIHKGNHWCLAIINKKDKKFQYLDSLGGIDSRVMSVLGRYFVDEVKDKSGKDINVSSWKEEFVTNLPQQENGFDCGMFMIKYVDFYSRDIELCFNQGHMPYFRRRTTNEILKLKAE